MARPETPSASTQERQSDQRVSRRRDRHAQVPLYHLMLSPTPTNASRSVSTVAITPAVSALIRSAS